MSDFSQDSLSNKKEKRGLGVQKSKWGFSESKWEFKEEEGDQ